MRIAAYVLLLIALVASASGCSMCQSCNDYAYPTYGGKWQRADRYHGRVGSAFAPAEAYGPEMVAGEMVEGTFVEGEIEVIDEYVQ